MGWLGTFVLWAGLWSAPEAPELQLRWEAPSACPQREDVEQSIAEFLGRESFGDLLDEVTIAARLHAVDTRWRLEVRVSAPYGEVTRDVEGEDCRELATAAGLIIAVALDPLQVAREEARREAPPEPVPEPKRVAEPVAAEQQRRWFAGVLVGGGIEVGAISPLGGALTIAVEALAPRASIGAYAIWLPPRLRRPFAAEPGVGARLQLGAVGARGCHRAFVGRFGFWQCLGLEAGAMRARGDALTTVRTSHRPWVAGLGAIGFGVEATRWLSIVLELHGLGVILRPRFVVDGLGELHRSFPVAMRAVLGPQVRF